MILPPPLCEAARARKLLDIAKISYVLVASAKAPAGRFSVSIDNYAAAYEMTTYLIELGHSHIGFIKDHLN